MTNEIAFEPKFWNGTHALSARQEELFAALVPGYGKAATTHGELLRCVTRIYYDLYNNGLCNGPFVEEAETLLSQSGVLTSRMERPEKFQGLLRAVAPAGASWGSTHVKDSKGWRHAPALEDLVAAAVRYADECEKQQKEAS